MIDFLRSEDALKVFSNTQEIMAMANMYNITIDIFTYGGPENRWSRIGPDPEMVGSAEERLGRLVHDMALYHSLDTHYDLLVRSDSRLALLGLLAGGDKETPIKVSDVAPVKDPKTNDEAEWVKVKSKKRNSSNDEINEKSKDDEKLLVEEESNDANNSNIDEEISIVNAKNNGFRRTGPQDVPAPGRKEHFPHKCIECKFEFESNGILEVHMKTHKKQINCEFCSEVLKVSTVKKNIQPGVMLELKANRIYSWRNGIVTIVHFRETVLLN